MSIATRISQAERQALHGQRPFLVKLYLLAIRPYMDYASGVVGLKRRISWRSLTEEMYVEPTCGVPKNETGSPSRNQLRRAIMQLERAGLIKYHDDKSWLVFECILATRDQSAQKQVDHELDQKTSISRPTSRPTKSHINPVISIDSSDRLPEAGQHLDQKTSLGRPASRPTSGVLTGKIKAKDIVHSRFDEFWKAYPRKENKKKAHALWVRRGFDRKADVIIRDITSPLRTALWHDKQYVPHPTTYLNGERWDDELSTPKAAPKKEATPYRPAKSASQPSPLIQEFFKNH